MCCRRLTTLQQPLVQYNKLACKTNIPRMGLDLNIASSVRLRLNGLKMYDVRDLVRLPVPIGWLRPVALT
eukprot:9794477-Prorocentrum_lima.AAC.1